MISKWVCIAFISQNSGYNTQLIWLCGKLKKHAKYNDDIDFDDFKTTSREKEKSSNYGFFLTFTHVRMSIWICK